MNFPVEGEHSPGGIPFEEGGGQFIGDVFPGILNSDLDGGQQLGAGEIAGATRRQTQHGQSRKHRQPNKTERRLSQAYHDVSSKNQVHTRAILHHKFQHKHSLKSFKLGVNTRTEHGSDSGSQEANDYGMSSYCQRICGGVNQMTVVLGGQAKRRGMKKAFHHLYEREKRKRKKTFTATSQT